MLYPLDICLGLSKGCRECQVNKVYLVVLSEFYDSELFDYVKMSDVGRRAQCADGGFYPRERGICELDSGRDRA